MKKKDIKTKVQNALNLALFELQVTPSKKTKKSLTLFSKDYASQIKDELKRQAKAEVKVTQKKKKVKKVKTV
jgi:hypothetical protein